MRCSEERERERERERKMLRIYCPTDDDDGDEVGDDVHGATRFLQLIVNINMYIKSESRCSSSS